jgi:hypothetical protein
MAINNRQTGLLAAEDWKKIYQSFREADFQSYDFSTLRKSMVDYLQLYYPEDFNDFIESSEYVALIDLIAFMGQSLAFRADLNTRENFIDTAERRDSILRLARLVSYVPKRNIPASGFLKINSVSTTESVLDSNGVQLANIPIVFNDPANPNWLEQFNTILNLAFVSGQKVGKPGNSTVIDGVKHEEYSVQISPTALPTIPFSASVDGTSTEFELVSATTIDREVVYEPNVGPSGKFNIIYKNDNLGYASESTGFFFYFKQGRLNSLDLAFRESLKNRVAGIDVSNINNNDLWLYQADNNGEFNLIWQQVPSVAGINIAYNPEDTAERRIYQVNTRLNDEIDLVFGDGAFAEVPQGTFRLYHRISNGLSYTINPEEMQNITISKSYVSKRGRLETLVFSVSLLYTVTNATTRESIEEVRLKAPQQYYTQNRMVNGEDYNIFPFTNFSSLIKVKAVNRTSSGISRFLDVVDTSGKYSSTNIFCQDGLFYRKSTEPSFTFDYLNTSDIQLVLQNQINQALRGRETRHFYYENFPRYSPMDTVPTPAKNLGWHQTTVATNLCTGWFQNAIGTEKVPQVIGEYTTSDRRYITVGSLIKFEAPAGQYFSADNRLRTGTPSMPGERAVIYAAVTDVVLDGTNGGAGDLDNGLGPVSLNQIVPTDAVVSEIIPAYDPVLSTTIEQQIVSLIQDYADFGLGYDTDSGTWYVIQAKDLDVTGPFDLANAQDTSGSNLDASWMMRFQATNQIYTARYRTVSYYFESELETRFYFDQGVKIFDSRTSSTIKDVVRVLKINSEPDSANPLINDYTLEIYANVVENDGYLNNKRVLVSYTDSDNDGIPDDPDVFDTVVKPLINPDNKLVFFQDVEDDYSFSDTTPVPAGAINVEFQTQADIQANINSYADGQLFYALAEDKYFQLSVDADGVKSISQVTGYSSYTGRQGLYFQYRHNSPNYKRIDPSPSNIIDIFLLTKSYDTSYRQYITDVTGKIAEPSRPTTEELRLEYNDLERYKPVSDAIIFSPAKYKPLFGSKAESSLRATFKVIKNPNVIISDSEIRVRVVNALNDYFSIDYWDFGETFYFSELSTYLHTSLVPYVASITIVPDNDDFGRLLQINAEPDEIFVNAATVDQVVIVPALTATQLKLT